MAIGLHKIGKYGEKFQWCPILPLPRPSFGKLRHPCHLSEAEASWTLAFPSRNLGTREKKDTTEISGSDPDNPGASIWVIDRFGISYILYAKGYGTGNIAAVYVGSAEKSVKKKGDYPLRTSSAILFLGAKLGTCSEGIIILNYGNYHIVINDIPRGKQSPRLMYDTSKTSLDRNFILDVKFTDGATLRETTLREGGSGGKITVVIDANGAHTALRKAASW